MVDIAAYIIYKSTDRRSRFLKYLTNISQYLKLETILQGSLSRWCLAIIDKHTTLGAVAKDQNSCDCSGLVHVTGNCSTFRKKNHRQRKTRKGWVICRIPVCNELIYIWTLSAIRELGYNNCSLFNHFHSINLVWNVYLFYSLHLFCYITINMNFCI